MPQIVGCGIGSGALAKGEEVGLEEYLMPLEEEPTKIISDLAHDEDRELRAG